MGKGQKPEVNQATQLLYDLCKFNKARKAVRVMEMMVGSGIIPDAASYTHLVNFLCKRGILCNVFVFGCGGWFISMLDSFAI